MIRSVLLLLVWSCGRRWRPCPWKEAAGMSFAALAGVSTRGKGRHIKIDVHTYRKEDGAAEDRTWFCTRLSICTTSLVRDGCDGCESYPPIGLWRRHGRWWWFASIFFHSHSYNESPIVCSVGTCIIIVLSIICSCFWGWLVYDVTFRSRLLGQGGSDWRGGCFTVQQVPYCLVQGVVFFCSCSA